MERGACNSPGSKGGADGTFFRSALDTNCNFYLSSSLPSGSQTDFIIVFIGFYS